MNEQESFGSRRSGAFWLVTLAACAGMLLTAYLGVWQLSRASQKITLAAEMAVRGKEPVLAGAELSSVLNLAVDREQAKPFVFREALLRGRWETDRTVFLDNRQMNGRQGFFVLTPLVLSGREHNVVLVQRGWVPRNFKNRTALPAVDTSPGEVVITGHLASEPAQTYSLGSGRTDSGFERIRQNLDLKDFRTETGLRLVVITLVQNGSASEGLLRDWPAVATGVDRHYGYAFQWFAFCALISGLYVWFQLVRPYRLRH